MYPNVTEDILINLRKLAEQEENLRVTEVKHRVLKQTYDINLAENLSARAKNLSERNESTKKLRRVFKKQILNVERKKHMLKI